MKKITAVILAALLAFSCIAVVGCKNEEEPKTPFIVGTDETTYEVEGHSEWAGTAWAYVKIVAGDDVIFNGKVTVTSDSLYASEFFYAAVLEKGLSQNGLEAGFVTSIGSYAMEGNMSWIWEYQGNTPTNFAVNDVHVFDGDYLLISYIDYSTYYVF